jgi:hypothetical protein
MGVKITGLPVGGQLSGFELFPFVQQDTTRQTAISSVFPAITSQGDSRYFCGASSNTQGGLTITGGGGVTIDLGLSATKDVTFGSITSTRGLSSVTGNLDLVNGQLSAFNATITTNLTAVNITATTELSAGRSGITTSGNLSSSRDIKGEGTLTIGTSHTSTGTLASIGGGTGLGAIGDHTFLGGGSGSCASGACGFVGGGVSNSNSGTAMVIGGGCSNSGSSNSGFIGGGKTNVVNSGCAVIGGGQLNTACATWTFIGGGCGNKACGSYSTVAGGQGNQAIGSKSGVGGGCLNCACADLSFIAGGFKNHAKTAHTCSAIVGGNCITSVSARMLHAHSLWLSAAALPTSDPGVPGVVWNYCGDLKISI